MPMHAWSHFCWLRAVDKAAQWEIRAVGQSILQLAAYGGARGVQGARGGAAMTEGVWHKKAQPLPWYGGKQSKAAWLHSLIPWRKDSTYVEPFGGMAGLICYRAPVKCEIFNDLDGRIVNWWRMVREERDALGELVEAMPHSESEYQWAKGAVDDENESDLRRALAFYVLVTQSVGRAVNSSGWQFLFDCSYGRLNRWGSERVGILCERIGNVQLFCRPAEKILTRTADLEHAVIYVDPPYRTADTSAYVVCELDSGELAEILQAQRGQVAISGYADEWDLLNWQRHELETSHRGIADTRNGNASPRTEVLWTNYDAMQSIGGLFADHVEALQ